MMAALKSGRSESTWTEFEVFCERMGWDPSTTTQAQVEAVGGKRGRADHWSELQSSTRIYKQCGICGYKFCVNNWADHRSRTPRLAGFVICADCDPRHVDDRYKTEGYRVIHPRRLKIIKQAQIARAMSTQPCMKKGKKKCKCISCTARKVMT